jgi:hypothetical protein
MKVEGIRLANYAADGIFEFGRLVSGRPGGGREFGDSTIRLFGKSPQAGLNKQLAVSSCDHETRWWRVHKKRIGVINLPHVV